MRKIKIYLDTSVINFLFADDAPGFMKVTEDFFENYVMSEIYLVYISDIVIGEIQKTRDKKKKRELQNVITKYPIKILSLNEEADKLSRIYIREGIIPKKKIEDAQHIAIATVYQMDILLSWNFKHLANINKQRKVKIVNEKEGYFYPLSLNNPLDVIYED